MKKRVIIIGGVVAAACLLGAGAWHFLKGKGKSSENVAYVTTVGSLTGEDVSGTQSDSAADGGGGPVGESGRFAFFL